MVTMILMSMMMMRKRLIGMMMLMKMILEWCVEYGINASLIEATGH